MGCVSIDLWVDGHLFQVAGLASADDNILNKEKLAVGVDFIFAEENWVWVCFQSTMQTHKE